MKRLMTTIATALLIGLSATAQQHEEVEWRHDVYRDIDLTKACNQPLMSPQQQDGAAQGLFAAIIDMARRSRAALYRHTVEGTECFSGTYRMTLRELLDDYQISYRVSGGELVIAPEDIPYQEVTHLYLREASIYDAANSTFKRRVIALCPVLTANDEVSGNEVRYPMCWLRYSDVEDLLEGYTTVASYENMAREVSLRDFFVLGLYQGDIYRDAKPYMDGAATDATAEGASGNKALPEPAVPADAYRIRNSKK